MIYIGSAWSQVGLSSPDLNGQTFDAGDRLNCSQAATWRHMIDPPGAPRWSFYGEKMRQERFLTPFPIFLNPFNPFDLRVF